MKIFVKILFVLLLMPWPAFAATSIPFTVNMSEAVNVVTTGGTPRIAVDVGGVTRYASYASGTGTAALTFTYAAVAGDVDLDGVTLTSPMDLNGGTIKDLAGNNATLTFTLPTTTGIKVDYPSLGMNFIADADGQYTLNGTAYNNLAGLLAVTGGSFSRAGTATYYDSTGVLQTASSGTPRFDYDPSTHAAKGLLMEEGRTNAVINSSALNSGGWTNTNVSVTPNVTTAPDGTSTADLLARNTTVGSNYFRYNYAAPVGTYTASAYVKAATTGNQFGLRIQGSYPDRGDAKFNLSTRALISTAASGVYTSPSATIQNVGNGWCRVTLTVTAVTSSITALIFGPTDNALSLIVWEGSDATLSDVYVWGVQMETGAFATSYIPTSGSAASRISESFAVNMQTYINAAAGTAFIDAELGRGGFQMSGNSSFLDLLGNDNGGQYGFARNSTGNIVVNPALAGRSKLAAAYGGGNSYTVADGGAVSSGAGIPDFSANSVLHLGTRFDLTGAIVNGHIRQFKYYPLRASNTQIQLITQ